MSEPIVEMPNNTKVAVNFSFALEEWLEPPRVKMALTADFPKEAVDRGIPDLASESWYRYGRRAGFPRLIRAVDDLEIAVSISASAVIVEKEPSFAAELVDAGHELVGHGYSQDRRMFLLSPQEQIEEIRRCTEIIAEATDVSPVGWSSQGGQRGDNTLRGLLDHGYIWSNDFRDSDYPYVVAQDGDRRIVAMPRTDEINDAMLFRRHGQPPSVFVELFKRALDQLIRESHLGTNVLTAVLHPTYYGHPYGVSALYECVDYARETNVAWIARRKDVANAFLATVDKHSATSE